MPGQEVTPTPQVSVITMPGDNVSSWEWLVLLVPETPAQHPAFSDLQQVGSRAPHRLLFPTACTICGQRQHMSGVCPTLIECDISGENGHRKYDCPKAKCDMCYTKGNKHSLQCLLHPINFRCTVCGGRSHLAWGKGICKTYSTGKGKGKGFLGAE
jgi:hypothetical protein